jgi:predicted regulator of Ras-like GTPase activity (Roadblock/LC7/MglB family)
MEATIDIRTADGNVNILLDEAQVGNIRGALVDLCLSTMAVFAMLIDAAGRVVAVGGETREYELEALAALAAADLATSRQLAAMLGEPEFSLLFQHEKQKNMFMTAIESDAILIVVFDVDTTFGTLRLRIRRSISQLQDILQQAKRSTVIALSETADVTRRDVSVEMAEEELSALALPARAAAERQAAAAGTAVVSPAPAGTPPTEAESPKAPPAQAAPGPAPQEVSAVAPEPAPPSPSPVAPAVPVAGATAVAPAPAAPPGGSALPADLAGEIKKALAWFGSFRGWALLFPDEVSYLKRAVEKARPDQVDTVRVVFLRTRARLTEQKRLLEARFRVLQSLYQQFVQSLQVVMQGAWKDEIVDRAMKAAFTAVGSDNNLVGSGISKKDGAWTMDFALIGKQLVTVCHARNMTYQAGMMEMVRQMNGGLTALSAFIIENPKLRDDLTKNWARIYRHYAEGLKTLDLEPEVLDLFRPLVRSGQMPK